MLPRLYRNSLLFKVKYKTKLLNYIRRSSVPLLSSIWVCWLEHWVSYWPSKNVIKMAVNVFPGISFIWWCILFFPSCFYIGNSYSCVYFSTNTNSFINITSWMDTRIFKFKKSFHFSSEPFYSDIIFIISKFVKIFHKLFTSNFMFITMWNWN